MRLREWCQTGKVPVSYSLHARTSDASVHAPAEIQSSPKFRKPRSTTPESSLRLLVLEPLETPRHSASLLRNVEQEGRSALYLGKYQLFEQHQSQIEVGCRKHSLWRALPLTAKGTSTHVLLRPSSSLSFSALRFVIINLPC